jgi:hypothetical protein
MSRNPSDERLAAALFSPYEAAAPALTWVRCSEQASQLNNGDTYTFAAPPESVRRRQPRAPPPGTAVPASDSEYSPGDDVSSDTDRDSGLYSSDDETEGVRWQRVTDRPPAWGARVSIGGLDDYVRRMYKRVTREVLSAVARNLGCDLNERLKAPPTPAQVMRLFLTDVFIETPVAVVSQGVGQLRDGRTGVVERISSEDIQSYLELVLVAGSVYRMMPMQLLEGEWRGTPRAAWTESAEIGRRISAGKDHF